MNKIYVFLQSINHVVGFEIIFVYLFRNYVIPIIKQYLPRKIALTHLKLFFIYPPKI